jgi:hypothetical protein
MNAARRVLLVDGSMGFVWAVYGFLLRPAATFREWWWVAALAAAVAAVGMYASDHGLAGFRTRTQGMALVAGFLAVVAGAAGLVAATGLSVDAAVPVGIGGLGLGLLAYRVAFGVVLPVPEDRLERAGERAV